MCGIIGIIDSQPVGHNILDGLRRLEYRGYDSAGIATLDGGQLHRRRAEGKLYHLEKILHEQPLPGNTGIGHTRWATHGAAVEANAHPHASEHVAVVHNGIIENFQELKSGLQEKGYTFTSETDTETVVYLLTDAIRHGASPKEAMQQVLPQLQGAFALAVLFTGSENLLIGARRGSPLVVGYGEGAMYLGSDALALASLTQTISYLQEDDWVVLTTDSAEVYGADGSAVERAKVNSGLTGAMVGKGRHRHYMAKEIHEQPTVIGDTLNAMLNPANLDVSIVGLDTLTDARRIALIACGTSYHAGLTARYWLEELAGVETTIDIASEYRYRPSLPTGDKLGLFISQSGETADTLAAMRHHRRGGGKLLSVVNVASSSMARESDVVLPTRAGPEIGVASTKAFTTQLTALGALAIAFGKANGHLPDGRAQELAQQLLHVPEACQQVLGMADAIHAIAHDIAESTIALYIGRGTSYAIALEGALKLKEISYIHAEGLAAGELKHGSIALIDDKTPIIVIAPHDEWFEKTASNVQEVAARGGRVILISDATGITKLKDACWRTIEMPPLASFIAPIVYSIPIQFLAYYVAVLKGTDVDQPRNLAKSVTVE